MADDTTDEDRSLPTWVDRDETQAASSIWIPSRGVPRSRLLWRDGGFAAVALLAGLIADLWGLTTAIWVVAVPTAGSGVLVAARMYETRSRLGTGR